MFFLISDKNVSHNDSALLTTSSELYSKETRRKCCNISSNIRLAKMAVQYFLTKNLTKSENRHFWRQNPLEPTHDVLTAVIKLCMFCSTEFLLCFVAFGLMQLISGTCGFKKC